MQSNPQQPQMTQAEPQAKPRRKRVALWASLGLAVVVCLIFPPVRFHRYQPGQTAALGGGAGGGGPFRAEAVARQVWDERLRPAAEKAPDAREVVAAFRADAEAARKRYARTAALGGPGYYFVRGAGRVVSKSKNQVGLHLDDPGSSNPAEPDGKPQVVFGTGPLFGNAVRDGTGLLSPGDYPNSGDYNELSAELNKLVTSRVLPTLREKADVGVRLRFAGVAEVAADETNPLPLNVVPLLVEVQ